MAFAATNSANRAIADMNITPLVDVMLVLLVIFMVTAPALTHSLGWQLPAVAPPMTPPPPTMSLQVQSGDVLALDGRALSRRDLAITLTQAVARNPQLLVKASVDPDAEYSAAVTALAIARNAGVENLTVYGQ